MEKQYWLQALSRSFKREANSQPVKSVKLMPQHLIKRMCAADFVRKVAGGCLIIERAGDINKSTAQSLSYIMEHDITGTLYILEDTSKGIKRHLSQMRNLQKNSQKEFQFRFLQMMNLYHLLCHIRLSWGIK